MLNPDNLMLTDEEFHQAVESSLDTVKKLFKNDSYMPSMQVICRDMSGKIQTVEVLLGLINLDDRETRKEIMEGIGLELYGRLADIGIPIAVILNSIGWATEGKDGLLPSESPNRQEVVCLFALTIDGRNAASFAFMKDDQPEQFKEITYDNENTGNSKAYLLQYVYRGFLKAAKGNLLEAIKKLTSAPPLVEEINLN